MGKSVQKPSQAVYNYVTIIPTLIYYKISHLYSQLCCKIHLIELKTYSYFFLNI